MPGQGSGFEANRRAALALSLLPLSIISLKNLKSPSFQHHFYPKGNNSWCRFWRDRATGCSTYQDLHRLPNVFMTELQPIFKRLSDSELLGRCLLGPTQNQNESLHGRLWLLVPKTTFCGKRRVGICVCEAICVSNTGAAANSLLLERLARIEPGENTLRALRQEDRTRLYNASQKVSESYRKRRKKLKFQKKTVKDEGTAYRAGGFGIKAVPKKLDVVIEKNRETNRKRKLNNSSKENVTRHSKALQPFNDVEILFIDETDIELGVTQKK